MKQLVSGPSTSNTSTIHDQGYVDEDADVMGKFMNMFGGKKGNEKKNRVMIVFRLALEFDSDWHCRCRHYHLSTCVTHEDNFGSKTL